MNVPQASTADLLDAWERGLAEPAPERPAVLLAAGVGGLPAEESDALPIGERDLRLLELRRSTFGSQLESAVACPVCSAELEFAIDAREIETAPLSSDGEPGDLGVRAGDYLVRFRLANHRDVRAAARCDHVEAARRVLLERCVLAASRSGVAVDVGALPPSVVERIEDAMAEHDPQADVRFALVCADCRHEWEAVLDMGQFVCAEVDRWARRLLVDVATLAAAFGWTESQVLALSATRRDAYLQLAGS